MERYAWKAAVLPGKMAEYRRRYDEIWPEMLEMFRRAGIRNYSIWQAGDTLFRYYECDNLQTALVVQQDAPVNGIPFVPQKLRNFPAILEHRKIQPNPL